MMKTFKRAFSWLLAIAMALTFIPALAEESAARVYTHNDRVTFVDGATADWPILTEADAAEAVEAMIPKMGGDERTRFEPWRVVTDTAQNKYYVFQQMYDETTVSGGAVKVVTDREGNMLGMVSSVETELPKTGTSEGIDARDAEAIVQEREAEVAYQILPEYTQKVILPVNLELDPESEEEKEESRFVWAVYTDNPDASTAKVELPYLAHYVTLDGDYLYSLPTILPGDEAATAGYGASYVFEFMESVPYTGAVTFSDGSEHEITVDVMRDQRTGMYYLGNLERRIAVADCYEFLYNKGHVVLEASKDNTGWDDTCLLSLYNYCRAWDYYNAIGWKGGDGLGTPMLILKDYCDKDREPIDNAAYAGRYYGWQLFLSSSVNDLAQCLDVLAHEFTHCVTGSVMTYNAYKNDYGAINEAMSDIQGNLCEMLSGATEDDTWELGEHSQTPVRSMSDPHKYQQPEYAWDLYYVPMVKVPTDINDRGGVHSNSSLLNNLAYRLCTEGGMTLEEARAFWFAVDCAMVPGTDYAQLSELLPWVLKNLGMEKYQKSLEAALDATRMRTDAMPETFDDDRALLTLTLPDSESFTDGNWSLQILSVDVDGLVDRLDAISENKGEYAGAMDELTAIFKSPEQTGSGDDFAAIIEGIFGLEAKKSPENSEMEPQMDDTTFTALMDWYKKYLDGFIYYGSGAAGQDGQTVRMVTRPGMTIPILLRLEMKASDMTPASLGLAVYTFGHWIDVLTPLKDILLEVAKQELPPEELEEAQGDPLLDGLMSIPPEEMEKLFNSIAENIPNMKWIINQIFYDIQPGQICVIPDTELQKVSYLDEETTAVIFKDMKTEIEAAR